MIKTASLENSKRLYELAPEWNDTHCVWKRLMTHETLKFKDWFLADWNNSVWDALGEQSIPAPDLDWLLDKLPVFLAGRNNAGLTIMKYVSGQYEFLYPQNGDDAEIREYADSAADAACLLLINLIEQGIVKV